MATIAISYSCLSTAASDARNISSRMDSYGSKITSAVTNKFNSLSGSDDYGYISAASRYASQKISNLSSQSSKASSFASRLDDFVTKAKQADKNVASNIKSTGQSYVGKRSFWQKVGDWLYNTFCVDLANSNALTKLIGNCLKSIADKASDVVGDIVNWFKYKDGKYVWNIVTAIAGVVAACVSAVVAVAAIVTSGAVLAIVLSIAAAVASVIVLGITIINAAFSIDNNAKALQIYHDHEEGETANIGQARYYGNIEGFSDAMKKYDMGDAQANQNWETAGTVVDNIETVCEIIIAINGFANLGGVKDATTGKVTSYDFSKENIWKNIKADFGWSESRKRKSVDPSTGKLIDYNGEKSGYKVVDVDTWSLSDMFEYRKNGKSGDTFTNALGKYLGFGKTDSLYYSYDNGFSPDNVLTLKEKFDRLSTGQQVTKTILDTGSVVSKVTSRLEDIDALVTTMKKGFTEENDLFSTAKKVISTLDFSSAASDLNKVIKPFDKFISLVKDNLPDTDTSSAGAGAW